tara:strand:- start:431 stop:616 length:186 start_codon:yes stop_codon:yes gene_type:complete
MSYTIKEKYKGFKASNFNLAFDKLKPHQVKNLPQHILDKYFTKIEKKAKKVKNIIKKIEDL